MKLHHLALALLLPSVALAQIYPLHVYATTGRAGEPSHDLKFMKSPAGVTYVGLCKPQKTEKLCDLAKDGTYKTAGGLSLHVKKSKLYDQNGRACHYVEGSPASLDCD